MILKQFANSMSLITTDYRFESYPVNEIIYNKINEVMPDKTFEIKNNR